jgi:hypothetical protein
MHLLHVGDDIEVSEGADLSHSLSISPLSPDSALACFADSSASELARCHVLWSGASNALVGAAPHICDMGSICRDLFVRPPDEVPEIVTNMEAKHIAEGSRPLRKTSVEYAMFPCRVHGTMMEIRSATFYCLLLSDLCFAI